MLCQICNKNPATIHVQEIINGEKKVFHLCGECASKKAETEPILQSFNLAEMLYNFTNEKAAESADAPEDAAPAAAVIAMLELIKSPFVDGDIEREIDDMDVFRALYLFSERDKAVSPILRWMRREEALDRLKNQFNAEKYPHVALIVAEQLKGVADAQAEFDAAAMRFAESLGAFHIADAASEIGTYLALAGGFSMLPENGSKKKDASTLTS